MEQMSLISKKKGERIDKFLGENLDDLSRSYIQKLLKDGLILVNGKKVKANYKLNEGDQIDVEVPDPEPLDIAAENIPLDILYEDDKKTVVVNILPRETIIIDVRPDHLASVAKVCYEIGNRHATLLHGKGDFQFLTPYTAPMKEMLEKIHGTTVHVDTIHLDFDKSISSTVNNHTH